MNLLEVQDLSVVLCGVRILDGISFSLRAGDWLMLVGPNGAGKSTLVGAISRAVAYSGKVLIDGQDASSFSARELARRVGVLSQSRPEESAFTVEEVVRLGGYARAKGFLRRMPEGEEEKIDRALSFSGLLPLRGRPLNTLSGGERQRAFLAQAFAQDPKILILDEPTNHLDLVFQRQIFSMIETWLRGDDRAVISVVHDLSLARKYATRALLLNEGRQIACGAAAKALSPKNLEAVYETDVYGWMRELLRVWTFSESDDNAPAACVNGADSARAADHDFPKRTKL